MCPILQGSRKRFALAKIFGKRRSRRARRAFCDKQNADKQRRATTSAARKTSAVSPLCGRARGVVLNSQDFAAVSSARNPRAFIISARFKAASLNKRTQFYKHSRKQNHASAIAHPCLRESALAGKVKPRDYAICVPLKYRAARKTSAVSPLCGRARGVVLNSEDFVLSAQNKISEQSKKKNGTPCGMPSS